MLLLIGLSLTLISSNFSVAAQPLAGNGPCLRHLAKAMCHGLWFISFIHGSANNAYNGVVLINPEM